MDTSAPEGMSEMRSGHGFVVSTLEKYLQHHLKMLHDIELRSPLTVKQFKSGQSNPTFYLKDGEGVEYVLRKKPPGKLLHSAHQIEREYKILKALSNCDFPVPKVLLFCSDEEVVGTPFYLMNLVKGRIFRDVTLKELSDPVERCAIYDDLNRVLAQLHSLQVNSLGLEDFSRSGNYYERQIKTWTRQYLNSKTDEIKAMDNLMEWLPKNIPHQAKQLVSIVHGDYRLDNVIFHPTEPKVIACLDWELSTVGHPFADLAYICMLWYLPPPQGIAGKKNLGIPSEQEFVRKYCERMGIKAIENWNFYLAFSIFRLVGIAQGVYKRALQGNASAPDALQYGPIAVFLAETAWGIALREGLSENSYDTKEESFVHSKL